MAHDPFARLLHRRIDRRRALALTGGSGAALALAATGFAVVASGEPGVARPPGWTAATHGKRPDPDYARVFPADRVTELTVTVAPERWAAMVADLTRIFGPRGPGPAPPGSPGLRPVGERREKPAWVAATVSFEGQTWNHVGFRFKGNSSLYTPWRQGADRMPFKLDFAQFGGEHPEVAGQRFHGFKQLSLANNFRDASQVRETVAAGLFADAGLVAARTALCHLTLDYGDGPRPLGLYTLVEVIDDTVVRRSFGERGGNLYEAEGPGAALVAEAAGQLEAAFTAKGKVKAPDRADLQALHAALHAPSRLGDPAAWRRSLEAVFDVDAFLTWLGLATTIQHWDTYGQMYHNFYLYQDRATGRLTWISWDHNFVLGQNLGGAAARNAVAGGSTSFEKTAIGPGWPLIRFLLDDPVHGERYRERLRNVSAPAFDVPRLLATYERLAALAAPYAGAGKAASELEAAIAGLAGITRERGEALRAFLAG